MNSTPGSNAQESLLSFSNNIAKVKVILSNTNLGGMPVSTGMYVIIM